MTQQKFCLDSGGSGVSFATDFIYLAKRKEVETAANETTIKRPGSDRWSVFVVTDSVYSAKGKSGGRCRANETTIKRFIS